MPGGSRIRAQILGDFSYTGDGVGVEAGSEFVTSFAGEPVHSLDGEHLRGCRIRFSKLSSRLLGGGKKHTCKEQYARRWKKA